MEAKEALKSHNEIRKNRVFQRIERMMKDAELYGTHTQTIKIAILENGFIDEDEQPREDYIQTKIFTINVQISVETI